MEVILLQKVENLGNLGDKVKVRAGYGRNFLIPQGKAKPATANNIAEFEKRRAELEKHAADDARWRRQRAQGRVSTANPSPSMPRPARKASCSAPWARWTSPKPSRQPALKVERKEVRMPQGPIRMAGEHKVEIHLHTDVNVDIIVNVVAEE